MTDVGLPPEVEGTWEFLSNGLIEANSHDQPWGFPHTEVHAPDQRDITVRVMYEGEPLPWVDIEVDYIGRARENGTTGEHGVAHLPGGHVTRIRVDPRKVLPPFMGAFNGAVYEITDASANSFDLTIRWVPFYVSHQLWLVIGSKLYPVEHFPMEKVH